MIVTSDSSLPDQVQDKMRCPTCGATQAPSDECRRCQTDLRMVRDVKQQYQQAQRRCLALLRSRRLKRATDIAHRCRQISSDEASSRLLAVCYLMQGNFSAALQVYDQSSKQSGSDAER